MKKDKSNSEYRGIFKGTAVFGGTQLVQIVVSLIKSKAVAILIGSIGMGVNALYTSSMQIITVLSGMGLKSSAVRDIAEATASNDKLLIGRKISILKKCFCLTCIMGVIITFISSPLLSEMSFGDASHIFEYSLLSFFVVFSLLAEQCTAILQGLHLIKKTATSTLLSCIVGLFTSILFFYIWGIEGIVYNIIVSSFVSFVIRYAYVRRLDYPFSNVSYKEALLESKGTFLLGFAMVVSTLIGTVVNYSINSFISNFGGITEVGYYKAGLILTTESVSLVFSSMAADYYPKLVVATKDREKMNLLVNNQGEIVTLISLPVLASLMFFSPLAIRVLFTPEFLVLNNFVKLLCVGILLQAISYSIGYISFAKGDKKTFFLLEGVWGSLFRLACYCTGYYFGGLQGIAISYIMYYFTYLVIILLVTRKLYSFSMNSSYMKVVFCSIFLLGVLLNSLLFFYNTMSYVLGGVIYILILVFAYIELNTRIDFGLILNKIMKR